TRLKAKGAGFEVADVVDFLDGPAGGLRDKRGPGKARQPQGFAPYSLRPSPDGRSFYVTDGGLSLAPDAPPSGGLWKVTYTGADARPAPRITDNASLEALAAGLAHPAHAERLR